VIAVAVRWYLRYGLSYRDVEELLAERGVEVDHVTIYRWVHRFAPLFADAARFARHSPGDRWCVDETYVKVGGVWRYVYRAVDEHGQHSASRERRVTTRTPSALEHTFECVTDATTARPRLA
jgi:transposase-like protein